MCLRPKIRYIASLVSWSLQQHQKIDKVPYQAYGRIYGLRRGFPLALIYTPINERGCGETKLSDEVNAMTLKILHSNMHLEGISATVSNNLIHRAMEQRRNKIKPREYVDSLIQWGCEMGLLLHQHKQRPMPLIVSRNHSSSAGSFVYLKASRILSMSFLYNFLMYTRSTCWQVVDVCI